MDLERPLDVVPEKIAAAAPVAPMRGQVRTILCQNCSQLNLIPHSGLTLSTGCERLVCNSCDTISLGGEPACPSREAGHVVKEYLVCFVCGASSRRNQTVDLGIAGLAMSNPEPCVSDTSDCTPHRVRATCGHVFCSKCFIESISDLLLPATLKIRAGLEEWNEVRDRRLARTFRVEPAGLLVPSCPLCLACCMPSSNDISDASTYCQPCRALTTESYMAVKSMAGLQFKLRRKDEAAMNLNIH
jgi:hypothetical protein